MDRAKTDATLVSQGIDHVQVAIPPGGEQVAGTFYVDPAGRADLIRSSPLEASRSHEIPGSRRDHTDDRFGNGIELLGCSSDGRP